MSSPLFQRSGVDRAGEQIDFIVIDDTQAPDAWVYGRDVRLVIRRQRPGRPASYLMPDGRWSEAPSYPLAAKLDANQCGVMVPAYLAEMLARIDESAAQRHQAEIADLTAQLERWKQLAEVAVSTATLAGAYQPTPFEMIAPPTTKDDHGN